MMGTAADQQMIENRQFQVEEIARAFGVFPQMLMASDTTTTFASAEAFFNAHIVPTMRPWVKRWEQALDFSLFSGRPKFSAKFDERGLFRMSPLDQMEFVARGLGSGGNAPVLTQNEGREMLGYLPKKDGDELLSIGDMTQASPSMTQEDVADET